MIGLMLFWQRIHYNVFAFNKFTQLNIFGWPVLRLLRNKTVKKSYQKRGVSDPEKAVRSVLIDKENSTIIWLTDVFMCLLIILLLFALGNLLSALKGFVLLGSMSKLWFLMICLIPSLTINYIVLWQNDEYLDYFRKFEKEPKAIKQKWAWISFGVIAGIMLLCAISFIVMTNALAE